MIAITLPFSRRMCLRLLPNQVKVDLHVIAASQGLEGRSSTDASISKCE